MVQLRGVFEERTFNCIRPEPGEDSEQVKFIVERVIYKTFKEWPNWGDKAGDDGGGGLCGCGERSIGHLH